MTQTAGLLVVETTRSAPYPKQLSTNLEKPQEENDSFVSSYSFCGRLSGLRSSLRLLHPTGTSGENDKPLLLLLLLCHWRAVAILGCLGRNATSKAAR